MLPQYMIYNKNLQDARTTKLNKSHFSRRTGTRYINKIGPVSTCQARRVYTGCNKVFDSYDSVRYLWVLDALGRLSFKRNSRDPQYTSC